jgi:alanine dehydrogenase
MIYKEDYETTCEVKEVPSQEEEFLEQLMAVSAGKRNFSVGVLKEMSKTARCVILSPENVKKLIEQGITVWLESGLGVAAGFSDMDYAKQGADIVEAKPPLILQSNILVKWSTFTPEELELTKPNQILIAMVDLKTLRQEDMLLLERKKITAIGLNFIMDENGKAFIDTFLHPENPEKEQVISLGNLVLPLLYALIFSYSIRSAIQTTPDLQQGIYAYQGILCKRAVSEKVRMPWKDLFMLCWDWN